MVAANIIHGPYRKDMTEDEYLESCLRKSIGRPSEDGSFASITSCDVEKENILLRLFKKRHCHTMPQPFEEEEEAEEHNEDRSPVPRKTIRKVFRESIDVLKGTAGQLCAFALDKFE